MKKEIVMLLLFAVAYPSQVLTTAIPKASKWDQAITSLNEYRRTVNNALNSALINDYATLSQSADSLIASIQSNGTSQITTAYNEYMTEYNTVKQSAQDAGIDITPCINSFETVISSIGPDNIDGLVQCVQDQVSAVVTYISGCSTNLVDRYLAMVYQIEKSILTCLPSDDDCLSNIVYTLVQANARVEGEMDNNLAKDVGQFGMYEGPLGACGEKYISINAAKGKSIVEGFESCVDAQSK